MPAISGLAERGPSSARFDTLWRHNGVAMGSHGAAGGKSLDPYGWGKLHTRTAGAKSACRRCRKGKCCPVLGFVCSCDCPSNSALAPLRDTGRGKMSPPDHTNQLSDYSSGKRNEPKPKRFGPDTFGRGEGLAREGVPKGPKIEKIQDLEIFKRD